MKSDFTGLITASAFSSKCRNTKRPTALPSLCCMWDSSSFTDTKGSARLFLCSQTAQVQHKQKKRNIFKQSQFTAVVKIHLMSYPQQGCSAASLRIKQPRKQCLPNFHPVLATSYVFWEHLKEFRSEVCPAFQVLERFTVAVRTFKGRVLQP